MCPDFLYLTTDRCEGRSMIFLEHPSLLLLFLFLLCLIFWVGGVEDVPDGQDEHHLLTTSSGIRTRFAAGVTRMGG